MRSRRRAPQGQVKSFVRGMTNTRCLVASFRKTRPVAFPCPPFTFSVFEFSAVCPPWQALENRLVLLLSQQTHVLLPFCRICSLIGSATKQWKRCVPQQSRYGRTPTHGSLSVQHCNQTCGRKATVGHDDAGRQHCAEFRHHSLSV